jgi:hypothetical protein
MRLDNAASFTCKLPSETKCQIRDKPLTQDRKYDNVLLGEGYRTLHGAVIVAYEAKVE